MSMIRLTQSARVCLVAVCFLNLSGCSEYLDRRDTVARNAGEAVQNNIVRHTVNPWPRHAFVIPRTTSGERSQRAVERYRNPNPGSGSTQSVPPTIRSGDLAQQRPF